MSKYKLIRGAYAVFYILTAILSADASHVFYPNFNLAKDGYLSDIGENNE